MSEQNQSAWPFGEIPAEDGLDVAAIFGDGTSGGETPPAPPAPQPAAEPPVAPATPPTSQPAVAPVTPPPPQPDAPAAPAEHPPQAPQQKTEQKQAAEAQQSGPALAGNDPIAAAFAQKTVENAQKGLLEKPPVFYHKGAKEPIEDSSMTFEELRIRKSEDFADLEEGKYVSWSVEYCGIRKDIKDPKGTTIISMKEMIERSREFLDALKKSKDKNPDCLVKPRIVGKTKGTAAVYKGRFATLTEARASDKVICLIPSSDGRLYELRKTEQGEFIAPKSHVADFQTVRAGFTPALPLIPMSLMGQIIAFFRSFMSDHEEYEALALIYWDKMEKRFFAYVPRQTVTKEEIEADLRECPYDDEERYIRYADIHSHNSMEAFFSSKDDRDERGTGLYFVLGGLDHFFPSIKARVSCGGSFVPIDPGTVIQGLERQYPTEWARNVTSKKTALSLKGSFSLCADPLDDLPGEAGL